MAKAQNTVPQWRKLGVGGFTAAPLVDLFFACFFVLTAMAIFGITSATGTTF